MSIVNYTRLKDFESLFKGLSEKELKLISGIMKQKEVNAGKIIINEGQYLNAIHFL